MSERKWAGMCINCGHDYYDDEGKPVAECTHYHEQPKPWEGLSCICAAIDTHRLVCPTALEPPEEGK